MKNKITNNNANLSPNQAQTFLKTQAQTRTDLQLCFLHWCEYAFIRSLSDWPLKLLEPRNIQHLLVTVPHNKFVSMRQNLVAIYWMAKSIILYFHTKSKYSISYIVVVVIKLVSNFEFNFLFNFIFRFHILPFHIA